MVMIFCCSKIMFSVDSFKKHRRWIWGDESNAHTHTLAKTHKKNGPHPHLRSYYSECERRVQLQNVDQITADAFLLLRASLVSLILISSFLTSVMWKGKCVNSMPCVISKRCGIWSRPTMGRGRSHQVCWACVMWTGKIWGRNDSLYITKNNNKCIIKNTIEYACIFPHSY